MVKIRGLIAILFAAAFQFPDCALAKDPEVVNPYVYKNPAKGTDVYRTAPDLEDAVLLRKTASAILKEAKLSAKDLTAAEMMLGRATYFASRSKAFLELKTKILLFKYPDTILFDLLLRFIRYFVLYPVLVATGQPYAAGILEVMPGESIFDLPYVWVRMWFKDRSLKKMIGMDPKVLRKSLFADIGVDLNTTNLHPGYTPDGNLLILPVAKGKNSGDLITQKKLESILFADKPLKKTIQDLHLDPALYERVLWENVLSDPSLAKKLLKFKTTDKLAPGLAEMLSFYLESQGLITRLTMEISESAPELEFSLSPVKFYNWLNGLRATLEMASRVNELRDFQLATLAAGFKDKKLPSFAMADLQERRLWLRSHFEAMKAKFEPKADVISTYELLQKLRSEILADPASDNQLFLDSDVSRLKFKAGNDLEPGLADLISFYTESQGLISQYEAELVEASPKFSFRANQFSDWSGGLESKSGVAEQIKKLREFQIFTITTWFKERKLPPFAMEDLRERSRWLGSGLQVMRERFQPKNTEAGSCQVLFGDL